MQIVEAVFQYQFVHNGSALQTNAAAYYLEMYSADGKQTDPPDEIMKHFEGHTPPVRKWSEAREKKHMDESGKNLKTMGFFIGVIKRNGRDEAEVSGGYSESLLSGGGGIYYLKRKEGKWVVEKDVQRWVK